MNNSKNKNLAQFESKKNEFKILIYFFWKYLKTIFSKWFFWLFFLPDLIGFLNLFPKINISFPPFLFFLFPMIGLLFSGFMVHIESLNKNDSMILPKSQYKLSLIEGNEYAFSLSSPYDAPETKLLIKYLELDVENDFNYENDILLIDNKPRYWLPKILFDINIRLENTGNINIDILNINLRYTIDDFSPLRFFHDSILMNSQELIFPLSLEPSQIEIIQFKTRLKPGDTDAVSLAQIMASLNKLDKTIPISFSVETLDEMGSKKVEDFVFNFSFRPLIDLFISQLQRYHQDDLLRLIDNSRKPE